MRLPRAVAVPGGRFAMGSESGRPDEAPVHQALVEAFDLGLTPVTNAEYAPFLEAGAAVPPPWWDDPAYSAPEQPAVGVSWHEASAFAAWLSERSGETWRLPTEAEWERAARGGLEGGTTAWGETLPEGEVPECSLSGPWRVGRGRPNGFGLLDVGTVVHEWCLDWYAPDYYREAPLRDPRGPEEGVRRSSRGGSWRHRVRWSPPAARSSLPPEFHYADYGFRLLRQRAPRA
jgi:formylglycine-generating enzyme required for sulfatase activity